MKYILSIFVLLTFSLSVTHAQSADEKALSAAIESLNKNLLKPDRAMLEKITSANLSFGHSSGKIEGQKEFIDLLVNGHYVYSTLNPTDQTIQINGNSAIVRHKLTAKLTIGGTPAELNIGALQVWQKENGSWKLYGRQGFKL